MVWALRADTTAGFPNISTSSTFASGQVHPGWPADGRELYPNTSPDGNRLYRCSSTAKPVSDGAGGMIVTWVRGQPPWPRRHYASAPDERQSGPRLAPNGRICDAERNQKRPRIATDGGGAIVAWGDARRGRTGASTSSM